MSTDGQGAATSRRLGALEDRRALWNREAQARLTAAGEDVLPAAVLTHALRSRWIPRTFRAAVDGYWRAHPLRAERLARGLASRSGTPAGWRWRLGPLDDLPASYRTPPLPFREPRSAGAGQCVVCGQPIFRLGWHREREGAGTPNQRTAWHACCVIAWKVWTHPNDYRAILSKLQNRRCAISGSRLLRTSEVDHRVPLFRAWSDHRDLPWPDLLAFWGLPNLQVINRTAHIEKSVTEMQSRNGSAAAFGRPNPTSFKHLSAKGRAARLP